jgi:hypothetical protein
LDLERAPSVFPDIAARMQQTGAKRRFMLSVNGFPVGWTDMHGASLDWIAEPPDL